MKLCFSGKFHPEFHPEPFPENFPFPGNPKGLAETENGIQHVQRGDEAHLMILRPYQTAAVALRRGQVMPLPPVLESKRKTFLRQTP